MAEVHQLIIKHGIEEARRQAITKHERMVIEAAYQVLSDDAEKMGFTYSGFALTSLPHKPQSELTWKRDGHNLTMLIQSGVDRAGKPLGLPYGSYARFILLFLQSEAIRTGSREVELGRSMRVWLGSMDLQEGQRAGAPDFRLLPYVLRRPFGRPDQEPWRVREDRNHHVQCRWRPARSMAGPRSAGRGLLPCTSRASCSGK